MSRGFVKEDDQEETPIIPPRAALPAGVTNYVTPEGLLDLKKEKEALQSQRASMSVTDEQQRRRDLIVIDGKLKLLEERILSARVLEGNQQNPNEVRFGATVRLLLNTKEQELQIVGVDEANVQQKKIAFVSPIAKAITGAKVGEQVDFQLGIEKRPIKILAIHYK